MLSIKYMKDLAYKFEDKRLNNSTLKADKVVKLPNKPIYRNI